MSGKIVAHNNYCPQGLLGISTSLSSNHKFLFHKLFNNPKQPHANLMKGYVVSKEIGTMYVGK